MKMHVLLAVACCAWSLAVAAAFATPPEEVALRFYENLRDGKTKAATQLCTPKAASMVPMMAALLQDEDTRGMKFKVTNVKIRGNTAEVEITSIARDGDIDENSLDLKKIGEDWKVDLHK